MSFFIKLARFPDYLVVGLNENFTSKICPHCEGFVAQVTLRRLYFTLCKMFFYRDTMAAENMYNTIRRYLEDPRGSVPTAVPSTTTGRWDLSLEGRSGRWTKHNHRFSQHSKYQQHGWKLYSTEEISNDLESRQRTSRKEVQRQRIKAESLDTFIGADAKDLALWRVSIPNDSFYVNAAKSDIASHDLFRLADLIGSKTLEDVAGSNTVLAMNITLLLILSRLMALGYCLKLPGCRRTFSSARWVMLQEYSNVIKDVFVHLCMTMV
ncbi:hypothetical protein BGX24_009777 [Mortierella sp. AD032]|nr:hypothetical protein BGX24_009777 [Mortierella sp. AD032]